MVRSLVLVLPGLLDTYCPFYALSPFCIPQDYFFHEEWVSAELALTAAGL